MKRVMLDEGVPRQLARALRLSGLEAVAFPNEWKQLADGALLDLAERDGFQVLITGDKNMPFQQSIAGRHLSVLDLFGVDRRHVPLYSTSIVAVLAQLAPGSFSYLGKDGRLSAERPS